MPRFALLLAVVAAAGPFQARGQEATRRPNVLLAISDDHSWLHTSASGDPVIRTPGFDRVAKAGVLFRSGFAGSPGCSPSRAALLTGRHHWQLEEAGTHASSFPSKYVTYPDLLEKAGYFVGMTGKGWGPGNYQASGRSRNPAGPAFMKQKLSPPAKGLSPNDYAGNFADFLKQRPKGAPFCFWFGAQEPHRDYEKGYGLKSGKKLEDVVVPPFLPDTPEVRSDLLDYLTEIEWFDRHLERILKTLEEAGELDDTLVIVTGDNGMSFPRAKANCYEYGIHVPLAIGWPRRAKGGREVETLVGFVDLTATILEAAGVRQEGLVGRSVLGVVTGEDSAPRDRVFAGRERHSSSRHENLGYPIRAIRTPGYLYVRNFAPDRWPAGDPRTEGGRPHGAYHDIDGCPTLEAMVARQDDLFRLAVARRPAEELFDVKADPACLRNLAADPAHAEARARLWAELEKELKATGDPRVGPNPEVWETYPRYSPIRKFPPPSKD